MSFATDLDLDPETAAILARYGFDAATFHSLRRRLAPSGEGVSNVAQGRIEPPRATDFTELAPEGSAESRSLRERGLQAIAAGQVGVIVLAGGMATRWGGSVKAIVEALPGQSFLSLKLEDARRMSERLGARIPFFLVVSFSTHDALVRATRGGAGPNVPIELVPQFASMRLHRDGRLVRDGDGRPSLYATGHGDLPFALRRSGALQRFIASGGKYLLMSNVDNLAATLDPAVIGTHIQQGRPITVEVVRAQDGDRGGAPARLDGKLQVLEGFRFPPDYPVGDLPTFNTNTMVFDAAALDRDFPLTWFAVTKNAAGCEVVQFERLVGELTAFLPATFLVVPRHAPHGRFAPAKDPEELAAARQAIEQILTRREVLPPPE